MHKAASCTSAKISSSYGSRGFSGKFSSCVTCNYKLQEAVLSTSTATLRVHRCQQDITFHGGRLPWRPSARQSWHEQLQQVHVWQACLWLWFCTVSQWVEVIVQQWLSFTQHTCTLWVRRWFYGWLMTLMTLCVMAVTINFDLDDKFDSQHWKYTL